MTKCKTPYCKNKRTKRGLDCHTCHKRKWRTKYPMKACFQTLRQNARRRGKPFTITFEYFQRFCYRTNYIAGKGRTRESYSIDCMINELGYVQGNLKVRPLGFNAAKGTKPFTKRLVYDYQTKYARVI